MTSSSVLFLDVDGVLNTTTGPDAVLNTTTDPNADLDDDKLALLATLLAQRRHAKLVLSSSWRQHPARTRALRKRLLTHGVGAERWSEPFATPVAPLAQTRLRPGLSIVKQLDMRLDALARQRCAEIALWLGAREDAGCGVGCWAALDDLDLAAAASKLAPTNATKGLLSRFVRTNERIGLSAAECCAAAEALDSECSAGDRQAIMGLRPASRAKRKGGRAARRQPRVTVPAVATARGHERNRDRQHSSWQGGHEQQAATLTQPRRRARLHLHLQPQQRRTMRAGQVVSRRVDWGRSFSTGKLVVPSLRLKKFSKQHDEADEETTD